MATQGSATLDFGAFPGSPTASLAITGQTGIGGSALVECWVMPVATADHSADEHIIDPPEVEAGTVIAGTGFTIYGSAFTSGQMAWVLGQSAPQGAVVMIYGTWNIAWVWS